MILLVFGLQKKIKRVLFFVKPNSRDMAKSLCHLLIHLCTCIDVGKACTRIFFVANMSFDAIRENTILAIF